MRSRKPRPSQPEPESVRLQAFLARAGLASRRASEDLIREGRVTINGRKAEIGAKVNPERDIVRVDGKVVTRKSLDWIAVHKPRGYVTTREDPGGRKTVYDLLPTDLHHLFHVGRLDRDSSGLLLLTNDGEAANRLLHPRYGTTKEYRADVQGDPDTDTLRSLVDGVTLEDGDAHAVSVESRGEIAPGVTRLLIEMQEGRNREVRRMLEAVGHPVVKLFRLRFGPITLDRLKPGRWRRLAPEEVAALRGTKDGKDRDRPEGKGGPRGGSAPASGRRSGAAEPSKRSDRRPSKGQDADRKRRRGPRPGPNSRDGR